ncbi:MAG: cell division ATP-binding protein FtsE [Clostridiales bacterium]|jgi:cell division transport system ATP-binding protein|nr:cell division ATP-binding protein FtsE [Clostridiales bacterium]
MIHLSDVYQSYATGTRALQGINLRIEDGEFVFLVGPSGSGKSTIIKLIIAELLPTAGRVTVNGYNTTKMRASEVPYLRRTIGVVFQDFRLIEKKTVYENVAFAMRIVGASPQEIRNRVAYVLDLVGLAHKARRKPTELSGGEQQRVSIARALVNNPSLIIADEPTGNLDPDRSLEIMMLLEHINSLGTTVLVVTHEKELVNQFNQRVVAIDGGLIVSDRTGGYYQYEQYENRYKHPGESTPEPTEQPEQPEQPEQSDEQQA